MHDPKNKNCQKSTCDEHHSALRNPIFGGTHECDCTCPEQKEDWEEELNQFFYDHNITCLNSCSCYVTLENLIRTQISLAEERGRREAKAQFDAMLAEDIENVEEVFRIADEREDRVEQSDITSILEARRLFIKK